MRGLMRDFTYMVEFMEENGIGKEIFYVPIQRFKITERRSLAFLREIDSTIHPENNTWIAEVKGIPIGEYKGFSLYVTLKGRLFVYDSIKGGIFEVFYREIHDQKTHPKAG